MIDTEWGALTWVMSRTLGSTLRDDHAAGETVLRVVDVDELTTGTARLDGQTVTITDVDYDTHTLTLTAPLARSHESGIPVLTGQVDVIDRRAHVELADGTAIDAGIDQSVTTAISDGTQTPALPVRVSEQAPGVWVVDNIETPALVLGHQVDPIGLPDPTPVDPPPGSPAITVTGLSESLIVRAGEIAASSQLEVHVSTADGFEPTPATLVSVSRSVVSVIDQLPTGERLQPGTTYYVRVRSVNAAGVAPASEQQAAQLDPDAVQDLIARQLVAGFVLAGRVQVGAGYLDADEGLVLPQPGGGSIRLPVDGLTPATISAYLIAYGLKVEGAAVLDGPTQVNGTIRLANGVSDPPDAPVLSRSWPSRVTDLADDGYGPTRWGLALRVGGGYAVASAYFGGGLTFLDGAGTTVGYVSLGTLNASGGVTVIGDTAYVLGSDSARDGRWFVRAVTVSTGTVGGEWEYLRGQGSPYRPGIGTDGTNIVIGRCYSGGALTVSIHNLGTGAVSGARDTGDMVAAHVTSAHLLQADLGAYRYVITTEKAIRVYDPAGTRQAGQEWAPAGGAPLRGLCWDGTRWHSLDDAGRVWDYSTRAAATSVTAAHAWVDVDTGGTGTHETQPSPTAALSWSARSWLTIQVPPAPDAGVTDPTRTDKADRARVYAAVSGGLRAQATLTPTQRSVTLETLDTTSKAPETVNSFASAAAAPGGFESVAADTLGPLIRLDGAGTARIRQVTAPITLAGAWTGPAWTNSWSNRAGFPVAYRLDAANNLHLRGCLAGGTWNAAAFTLPAGMRPASARECPTVTDVGAGRVRVNTDGTVVPLAIGGGTPTWISAELVINLTP